MMLKPLKFPDSELAKPTEMQHQEELKRKLADPHALLFKGVHELVRLKCKPEKQAQVQAILERQPFGEVERLITQKLFDVVRQVAREEPENEDWLRLMARVRNRRYEDMRVSILEFLDALVSTYRLKTVPPFWIR